MDFTIGKSALLACQWEATTPKPGNVHRGADFDDATLNDFLTSAAAIAPILNQASQRAPGQTVMLCVNETRQVVPSNTNLGIILLLAPLASVPADQDLRPGVRQLLANLTQKDASSVYFSIRLAHPGGLGDAEDMDVNDAPPSDLLAAMQLAAHRDAIAEQYVTGFARIFDDVVLRLLAGKDRGLSLTASIIRTHVSLIADFGDSLICRKCGLEVNAQAKKFAAACLAAEKKGEEAWHAALADFDFWLRADGRKRNPGTTADLIAAGLFVIFRDGLWPPPWK